MKPGLLLMGFGQINGKVAQQLAAEFNITAVSKSPRQFSQGRHLALDLANAELAVLPQTDYIVYCLTPASYDEQSYTTTYIDCLRKIVDYYRCFPIKRLFFVSSTSVYGQNDDELIDENSATEPSGFNGKVLVEAERNLQQTSMPTTSVRFSGIYGQHRSSLFKQIQRGDRSSSPPSRYTNRISEKDAVGTLCHLLRRAEACQELADCYLASDNQPTRMHEIVAWARKQIPCQPETGNTQSERAGSKRCNNQRLRDSGYTFLHPTFKEGYGEIIAAGLFKTPP